MKWVPVEIVAAETKKGIDSVRMQAIITGRWDPKTWKVLMP